MLQLNCASLGHYRAAMVYITQLLLCMIHFMLALCLAKLIVAVGGNVTCKVYRKKGSSSSVSSTCSTASRWPPPLPGGAVLVPDSTRTVSASTLSWSAYLTCKRKQPAHEHVSIEFCNWRTLCCLNAPALVWRG
eukprot:1071-Heterococcus_DN1.PRE.5